MAIPPVSSQPVSTPPQIDVAPPPPPAPPAPLTPAVPKTDASSFEPAAPQKPVVLTGDAGTPPAGDDSLKADVAAARLSGGKSLNPNAVPLEYVEKGGAVIQKGQSGQSVTSLQEMLNRAGANPKLSTSGTYDSNTEAAVKALQQKHKLPDDGRVAADTLIRIRTEDAKGSLPASLDPSVKKEIAARLDFDPSDVATREAYVGLAKSPGFDKLGAAQQKQAIGILDVAPKDAALSTDLKKLVATDSFRSLDPSTQKLALEKIEAHASDPAARSTLIRLSTSWGFNKLPQNEQHVFLHELGATNSIIAPNARKALDATLTKLDGKTAVEQRDGLSTFLKEQDWPDWKTWDGAWKNRTTIPDSVTGPASVATGPFQQTSGPADQYDVKYGNKTIPVFVPAGTKRGEVDKLIATMDALPHANRETIDRVIMEAKDKPPDPPKDPNAPKPGPAAFDAGGGVVRAYPTGMGLEPKDRRMSAMIHESAHLIDKKMQSLDPKWNDDWKKAMADDIAKPSQYGKKSDAEDFAEAYLTYKLFENDPAKMAEFRSTFPARFKLIDDVEQRAKNGEFRK